MLLIPAITLKDGKCVDIDATSGRVPGPEDALQAAAAWIEGGAQRLHVTDRDAGTDGKQAGVDVIRALVQAHPVIPVQVAGNFRSGDDIERYLSAGTEYVFLGASASITPHFINDMCLEYPGHILMVLETKSGKVIASSRSKSTRHPIEETARRFEQDGVAGILYQAVPDADGSCDFVPAVVLASMLTIPVLVSAKLRSFEAVCNVCRVAEGLAGVVLDSAYSRGPGDFTKGQKYAEAC